MKQDIKLWTYYQGQNKKVFDITKARHEMVYDQVVKYLKDPSSKIIEMGFGDGYLLKKIANKYKCFGADISPKNVDQMKIDIPNVEFRLIDDNGKLPYENDFFDGYIASEVLEHLTDEDLFLSVSEMGRILKQGGYAIITVPAKENLEENKCFCPNCGEIFHKWGHKQYWDDDKIKNVFKDFDIVFLKKVFIDNGLNIFGKIDLLIKKIYVKFFSKDLSGMTYLIIMTKK